VIDLAIRISAFRLCIENDFDARLQTAILSKTDIYALNVTN